MDKAQGIFTEEQQDYVNSVKDCDLRANLLHQIRLRDNMEQDRDSFEKKCNKLTDELKKLKQGEGKTNKLTEPFIAEVWASEFKRIIVDKKVKIDEGLMIGWFANAFMKGFDEAKRRRE